MRERRHRARQRSTAISNANCAEGLRCWCASRLFLYGTCSALHSQHQSGRRRARAPPSSAATQHCHLERELRRRAPLLVRVTACAAGHLQGTALTAPERPLSCACDSSRNMQRARHSCAPRCGADQRSCARLRTCTAVASAAHARRRNKKKEKWHTAEAACSTYGCSCSSCCSSRAAVARARL